jgi:hypothetical protein
MGVTVAGAISDLIAWINNGKDLSWDSYVPGNTLLFLMKNWVVNNSSAIPSGSSAADIADLAIRSVRYLVPLSGMSNVTP